MSNLIGFVSWHGSQALPVDHIHCNGQSIPVAGNEALHDIMGDTFGGDGGTNFNMPDLQGRFIRGWDAGRGIDIGRGFGTTQEDEFEEHTHNAPMENKNLVGNLSCIPGTGNAFNTSSVGGAETRPRNVALKPVVNNLPAPVLAPIGLVVWFVADTAPIGFLPANGAEFDTIGVFADLFAVIATAYNTGGETPGFFRVPDLRGEFVRGHDAGRAIDAGRVLGTAQGFSMDSHRHTWGSSTGATLSSPSGSSRTRVQNNTNFTFEWDNAGGVETRPKNLALLPCIKF